MGPHYEVQPTMVEREAMKHKGVPIIGGGACETPLELDFEIMQGVEHDSGLVDYKASFVDPLEHTFQGLSIIVRRRRVKKQP